MALLKCKMCGGDLEVLENSHIAQCEFCGTKQTVPGMDNEKKLKLFDRANKLRIACEFDKAFAVYEGIAGEFETEAEAYWGLVLCKYGIEYVDDPTTGDKIPTCHRSSFDSVLEDANYLQAVKCADVAAKELYKEEAQKIESLRCGIIEISSREEPYDIFICYKETDKNKERTLDSVKAQEIYDALTEKGYKVFFSRITLEDKLGVKYEPYIFSALQSARVMLVVATEPSHIEAVWVKNEWSRYLKIIEKDSKKALIPCYLNMDAYDLPSEFSGLQGQDLSKLGAMQDLIRGITKIVPLGETKAFKPKPEAGPTVENYLKRAEDFLKRGKFYDAVSYCENVLDIDYSNGTAYLYKVLAENKLKKISDLSEKIISTESDNYLSFEEYAHTELLEEVHGYLDLFYNNAIRLFEAGKYKKSLEILEKLINFKEAKEGIDLCHKGLKYVEAKALFDRKRYEDALSIFEKIPDFEDASDMVELCKKRIAQEKERVALADAQEKERVALAYERYLRKYPILKDKERIEKDYRETNSETEDKSGCLGGALIAFFILGIAGFGNIFTDDPITLAIAWGAIGLGALLVIIAFFIALPSIGKKAQKNKIEARYKKLKAVPPFDPNQNYDY